MTTEMWLIAAFRIAGALPVFRWPLAGAFIALFADLTDLFLREWLDLGGVKDYQRFDKWLDQAYMLTFLFVAIRWQALPRNIAVALYTFRLAGFVTFEITGDRDILLLFPNLFEYWFIFVASLKQFGWEDPGAGGYAKGERRPEPAGVSPSASVHVIHYSPQSWPIVGSIARFAIPFRYSRAQLVVALGVCLVLKLFHEYTLHVGQWFEGFTATEALEAIWRFLTPPF